MLLGLGDAQVLLQTHADSGVGLRPEVFNQAFVLLGAFLLDIVFPDLLYFRMVLVDDLLELIVVQLSCIFYHFGLAKGLVGLGPLGLGLLGLAVLRSFG